MTADLFIGFTTATALTTALICAIYLPRRTALGAIVVLALWLVYAGASGYLGVLRDPSLRPPGIVYLLTPVFLAIAGVIAWSKAGSHLALAIPVQLLILFQTFRIGVEASIHKLWEAGLVPHLMTLPGGNIEAVFAVTAPLAAWMSRWGGSGAKVAIAWNAIGLLSLANIAARAVLTSPGPLNAIHAEVMNTAFGLFPFTFVPGFLAPLAVTVHILTIRALRRRLRTLA